MTWFYSKSLYCLLTLLQSLCANHCQAHSRAGSRGKVVTSLSKMLYCRVVVVVVVIVMVVVVIAVVVVVEVEVVVVIVIESPPNCFILKPVRWVRRDRVPNGNTDTLRHFFTLIVVTRDQTILEACVRSCVLWISV